MRWPLLLTPRLDWLQVEVSSHCNARCRYCPRTLAGSRWPSRLMDPALFERLRPVLRRTRLVYLQGWGEPFLHPRFMDFVSVARRAGCAVSTTTCGQHMDESLAAAEVIVEEVEGNPGYYTSKFFLRPHYQLEGLTVSLRLVSKLPSAKGVG